MEIEQLRDELASLYCELKAAQLSGDDEWIEEVHEALKEAQKELAAAEEDEADRCDALLK